MFPTSFDQGARFILPRVTGKCNVRARPPMRNLPRSSKDFFSNHASYRLQKEFVQLTMRISLHWRKKRGDTTFRSIDLAETDTHTHTPSTSISYIDMCVCPYACIYSVYVQVYMHVHVHNVCMYMHYRMHM